jgi:hypothetical protein
MQKKKSCLRWLGNKDLVPLALAIFRPVVDNEKVRSAAVASWLGSPGDLSPVTGAVSASRIVGEAACWIVVLPDSVGDGLARLVPET